MPSRRDVLAGIAAGSATVALAEAQPVLAAGAAPARRAEPTRPPASGAQGLPSPDGPPPLTLLHPLGPGTALGEGWSIASLGPVAAGAALLLLRHEDGREARVHLCAHDGRPLGLAHTPRLDLVLMNGGDGARTSDEVLGCVLLGLAEQMERNEEKAFAAEPSLAALLPHRERIARFSRTAPEALA
jgi:hypothetical protein